MKKIERSELLDLGAYEQIRPRFLQRIIDAKRDRRVSVGAHMTFIFENRDTVLFQIQEMLRTERITKGKAIEHELETYNTMVPADGELFATLMIEYDDRDERRAALEAMADLGAHVAIVLGERRFQAEFELQPGEDGARLPAVNYVRFRVGPDAAAVLRDGGQPARLVIDHATYPADRALAIATRRSLADDLDDA